MKNETKGIASLVTATFLYSFFGVLTRILGFSLPLFYATWTRDLLSALILLGLLILTKQWVRVKPKDWKWFALRTIGGIFGLIGSFIAFYYIPIGTAYFIFFGGSTIGGYIVGKLLFGERLTTVKLASLVLAMLGLFLVYSLNFQTGNALYALCALGSGFGTAVWNTFSKKISQTYSALQLNFMDFSLSVIFLFGVSILLREQWIAPALNISWLANLLFVVMLLATGQLMVYGFRHMSAQIGSLIMLSEALFGIVWGGLIYKETLSAFTLLGGLLIVTAIILPELRVNRAKS